MSDKVRLLFMRSSGGFNAGEIAAFSPTVALKYVRARVARLVTDEECDVIMAERMKRKEQAKQTAAAAVEKAQEELESESAKQAAEMAEHAESIMGSAKSDAAARVAAADREPKRKGRSRRARPEVPTGGASDPETTE